MQNSGIQSKIQSLGAVFKLQNHQNSNGYGSKDNAGHGTGGHTRKMQSQPQKQRNNMRMQRKHEDHEDENMPSKIYSQKPKIQPVGITHQAATSLTKNSRQKSINHLCHNQVEAQIKKLEDYLEEKEKAQEEPARDQDHQNDLSKIQSQQEEQAQALGSKEMLLGEDEIAEYIQDYQSLKSVLRSRYKKIKLKQTKCAPGDKDAGTNSIAQNPNRTNQTMLSLKKVNDEQENYPDLINSSSAADKKHKHTHKKNKLSQNEQGDSDETSSNISGQTASSEEDEDDSVAKCCNKEAIFNYLLPCLYKRRNKQIHPQVQDVDNKDNFDLEMQGDDCHNCSGQDSELNIDVNQPEVQIEDPEILEYKNKYCDKSLNFFLVSNCLRKNCIRCIESPIFEGFVLFLIFLNSVQLGFIDYIYVNYPQRYSEVPWNNEFQLQTEGIFTFLYTMECLIKIVAMGLFAKNGCYLRDMWNWLDFTVVITALLQIIPQMANVRAIRSFRLLRPLRSLSAVPSMKILMNTLFNSLKQLTNILIVDTFFILIFAILGLQMWQGIMHYHCRETEYPENGDWIRVQNNALVCGGANQCDVACGSLFELELVNPDGVLQIYHINSTIDLYKDSKNQDLNYGITNFDNLGSAYLTIFQCTTLEGWSHIMNIIKDGYNEITTIIFFISCVIICSYFLINLTVAVMLDQFKALNKENSEKQLQKFIRNQERVQELRDVNIQMRLDQIKKNQAQSKIMLMKKLFENYVYRKIDGPTIDSAKYRRYKYLICRICYRIIKTPIFNIFINLLIIANTLLLATDSYPPPEFDLISSTHKVFTILFLIECVIRLIGLRWSQWKKEKFNVIDLLIVIISIGEMFQEGGMVSVFRSFRLLRLLKLARSNVTLRSLTDSIIYTIKAILNFMIVLAIFIYVFALLGMETFAGMFKFDKNGLYDPNGEVPRQNFDTLSESLITVFQILVGDQWNFVMYKAYLASGESSTSVAYFIILVLLGRIIMLNLFLSIMLGNFEMSSLIIKGKMEDQILKIFEKSRENTPISQRRGSLVSSHKQVSQVSLGYDTSQQPSQQPYVSARSKSEQFRVSKGAGQSNSEMIFLGVIGQGSSRNNAAGVNDCNPFSLANEDEIIGGTGTGTGRIGGPGPIERELSSPIRTGKDKKSIQFQQQSNRQIASKKKQLNVGLHLQQNSYDQTNIDKAKENYSQKDSFFNSSFDDSLQEEQLSSEYDMEEIVPQNRGNYVLRKCTTQHEDKLNQNDVETRSQKNKNKYQYFQSRKKNSSITIKELHQEIELFNKKEDNQLPPLGKSDQNSQQQVKDDHQSANVIELQEIDSARQPLNINSAVNPDSKSALQLHLQKSSKSSLSQSKQKSKQKKQNKIDQNQGSNNKNANQKNQDDSQEGQVEEDLNFLQSLALKYTGEPNVWALYQLVTTYMSESALFILHKDSQLRQFLLLLTTAPVVKSFTQKDFLLSQIQNGGDGDDSAEDEVGLQNSKFGQIDSHGLIDDDCQSVSESPIIWVRRRRERLERQLENQHDESRSPSKTIDSPDKTSHSRDSRTDSRQVLIKGSNDCQLKKKKNKKNDQNFKKFFEKEIKSNSMNVQFDSNLVDAFVYVENLGEKHRRLGKFMNKNKWFRNCCIELVGLKNNIFIFKWSLNQWFEYSVYSLILVSMVLLMLDNPLNDPSSQHTIQLSRIDFVVSILFALEAFIRIIALGFYSTSLQGRKAYIRHGANQIDFFVCLASLVYIYHDQEAIEDSINQTSDTLKSLKVLRAFRALRPLRVVSRNQGIKLAVGSLFGALPAILNGFIVTMLAVFIYAIVGISLFKGQFYHCSFPSIGIEQQYEHTSKTKQDCREVGGMWTNEDLNFDNIYYAMSTLYQIITTEGWLQIMYHGVDSKGIDMQPEKNSKQYMAIYFISFIVVGNIFILNLFVGIVIDKFNRLKDRMCGYALMTSDQRLWVEKEQQMIRLKLQKEKQPPKSQLQIKIHNIQNHHFFENFITVCIITSTLCMGLQYYQMPLKYYRNLEIVSFITDIIYNIEALIKYYALRKEYFINNWNIFDFLIVVAVDIALIIEQSSNFSDGVQINKGFITFLTIFKQMRILRLIRLVRVYKEVRLLIDSMLSILPSIMKVSSLTLLMFFIFAVIGMNMFSSVIHIQEINQHNNFMSFTNSLVTLTRCATGENWNIIMSNLAISNTQLNMLKKQYGNEQLTDLSHLESYRKIGINVDNYKADQHKYPFELELLCVSSQTFKDRQIHGPRECGTSMSYIYFGIFIIVFRMMMLNLFIAVVLEGFTSTNKEQTGEINSEDFAKFIELWSMFDKKATGWIGINDLCFLVFKLDQPLGLADIYKMEIQSKLDQDDEICMILTSKDEGMANKQRRYLVNIDHNMVIPKDRAIKIAQQLKLPVYGDLGDYKCHFRDVIKRLYRLAMQKINSNFNPNGIGIKQLTNLCLQWSEKYPSLDQKKEHPYDSGKLLAFINLRSCLKNVIQNKQARNNVKNKKRLEILGFQKQFKQKFGNTADNDQYKDGDEIPTAIDGKPGRKSLFQKKKTIEEMFDYQSLRKDSKLKHMEDDDLIYVYNKVQKVKEDQEKSEDKKKKEEVQKKKLNVEYLFGTNMISKFQKAKQRQKTMVKDFDPKKAKDDERSTWWMEDKSMNYKMEKWFNKMAFASSDDHPISSPVSSPQLTHFQRHSIHLSGTSDFNLNPQNIIYEQDEQKSIDVDFRNLNEGFSQGVEKLSFITDPTNKPEGISIATSPQKTDMYFANEHADKIISEVAHDQPLENEASGDPEVNQYPGNNYPTSSRKQQLVKSTTFGVENSNIMTIVNQINKE